MKWLILLLGIVSNASASVLVKLAMSPGRPMPSMNNPLSVLQNWPLLLGVALYGAAFVLYAAALARLPLNVAHPILTSGAIATVALLSVVLFQEPMRWNVLAGIVLIIAGVALITLRHE